MNTLADCGCVAEFPSRGVREEMLSQLRLWNQLEDLPRIRAEALDDGLRVRFLTEDPADLRGIARLVDAYGGRIVEDRAGGVKSLLCTTVSRYKVET